jgi:membrane-associated PAP2 superfamily phosphatase
MSGGAWHGLGKPCCPALASLAHVGLGLGGSLGIGAGGGDAVEVDDGGALPWDLRDFGGYASFAADYAGSWWVPSRAEAGRCLPSGHAGAGFCLLALYFFGMAAGRPRWRWAGLAAGVAAGLSFGFIRVVQGAHFPSHVMWAAVVCWLAAALVYLPVLAGKTVRGAWGSRGVHEA